MPHYIQLKEDTEHAKMVRFILNFCCDRRDLRFFGIVVSIAATIAKILFVIFLVLFVISLFTGRKRVS